MAPSEAQVVCIQRSGPFTLTEARQLLPVVRRITKEYALLVESKLAQLDALGASKTPAAVTLEEQVNDIISKWHQKIRKLGAEPKGLWLVDFDSGEGFFCWKYPELELNHWHSYQEGYTKRKPVAKAQSPTELRDTV